MKTIETTVYTFDELDDHAKEKAREWYRDGAQAITLPDGYNGHTVELDVLPVLDVIRAPDGRVSSVKLRATGSTYLIRWVYVGDYERLSGRKL